MSVAVVPVKQLADGKSRLHPKLTRVQLAALSLAMLEDILEALEQTPSLDRCVVVTPDVEVAAVAAAAGSEALLRPDPGLNASIDEAAREARLSSDESLLVVLGDVAGAMPGDVEALFVALRELGGRGVVLAASHDGGTSALLRCPRDAIPSCFGADSARAHREAARIAGVPYHELALPSLAVDLDCASDVERFLASGRGGARTRAHFAELGWSDQV